MAYDPSKDEELEKWENDETGLVISLYRYGEGEPKLQIGPRFYHKSDGSKSARKAGRLTIEDVLWLDDIIEDVKDKMNGYFLEES